MSDCFLFLAFSFGMMALCFYVVFQRAEAWA